VKTLVSSELEGRERQAARNLLLNARLVEVALDCVSGGNQFQLR